MTEVATTDSRLQEATKQLEIVLEDLDAELQRRKLTSAKSLVESARQRHG